MHGLALGCAGAFVMFVLVPHYYEVTSMPAGLGLPWVIGTMITVLLGPLVVGLTGYASFVALWLHGDALPTTARRLHLMTLLLSFLVLGLLVSVGADVLTEWTQ